MHIARLVVVWTFALLIFLAASHGSEAQISSAQVENAPPAAPQAGGLPFTRTVTITLETGPVPVLTPALASYWQTSITDFSSVGWNPWVVSNLPSDATDVTATVTGGTYQIVTSTNTIVFTFTDTLVDFGWAYRTSQKVLLQGNQYRIDQYASTNQADRPFVYISTVFFTSPFQYVGQIGPDPVVLTNASVHWEKFVDLNDPPYLHRFSSSMWLADLRLDPDRPNLKIAGKSVTIDPYSSIAHVTVQIQNNGQITTGAPVYLNLFERQPGSLGPAGPLDMAGGWCSYNLLEQPDCPTFNYTLGNTSGTANALPPIGPLQVTPVVTVTANLTLTQPGYRDIWIQVDAFGGSNGLNRESDEGDNSARVGQVPNPYLVYLPHIVKKQ